MATRDAWFDNAKMTLVTLVVVGHAWTLLPDEPVVSHLYDFLYLWHVPAFVFVTGYLSRSFEWTSVRMWQLVRTERGWKIFSVIYSMRDSRSPAE